MVHGRTENLLIEGNIVEEDIGKAEPGCWGIAIDHGGYPFEEYFTNVIIRCNIVRNVGNMFIGFTHCIGCTIENNLLIQEQSTTFQTSNILKRYGNHWDCSSKQESKRRKQTWYCRHREKQYHCFQWDCK